MTPEDRNEILEMLYQQQKKLDLMEEMVMKMKQTLQAGLDDHEVVEAPPEPPAITPT